MMRNNRVPSALGRALGVLLAACLLVSCASQPSKYKRAKGCDCPKWNRVAEPAGNSVRA
jgi:hypothetical protein